MKNTWGLSCCTPNLLHLECWGFTRIDSVLFTVIGKINLALRRHYDPAMFEPENLARILCPEKYEYVLDRWVFHSSSSFCWQSQCNIIVFVFPGIVSNMNLTIPYIFELFLWSTATCLNLEALTPLLQQGFIFDLLLEQAWTCLFCRHYGPMVFNLCWNKQQDELLVHLVVNDR